MHGHGGYDSDFSDDEHCGESSKRKKKVVEDDLLLKKPFQKEKHGKVAHKQVAAELLDRENDKTDMDVIRENHRFLWNEEDEMDMNWEKRLAKKYYDKLFKEYCIADLSRYKENKVFFLDILEDSYSKRLSSFGFRWRIEKEVISGKANVPSLFTGQFFCGNKYCEKKDDLKSWEVNFGYIEHGEKRNALVKLSKLTLVEI
ncbi:Protein FRA10AC1 [Galemys pyrenaicus]|uniref:Protein FRA10AC1 n=1 Tax=Galemys pyrenaicus TaxID=202257 RepID=A0A8J6AR43_GALPY|nr:Protein FRA10AC1 [Galemys pyrenaicus]